VYPLKEISCTVRGYIELDKNMASIGKRGYCIDRVKRGIRRSNLIIENSYIESPPMSLWSSGFRSVDAIGFNMDRELYEIPDVVIEVCDGKHVIRRSFSIQPEALKLLKKIPGRMRGRYCQRSQQQSKDLQRQPAGYTIPIYLDEGLYLYRSDEQDL
jgi:hypothetical protein